MEIDPQREKFYRSGTHERHVQEVLERIVRPGDVGWDAGAHVGFFTLAATRLVGEAGWVVAFEPISANNRRLERNLALKDVADVEVVPGALGGETGDRRMQSRGPSIMWTLDSEAAEAIAETVSVRLTTMDQAVARLPVSDMVKIDAALSELDVIRGGLRTLRHVQPAIVLELTDEMYLAAVREMLSEHVVSLGDNHLLLLPLNRSAS
jgi:FkbM family methyltransferase